MSRSTPVLAFLVASMVVTTLAVGTSAVAEAPLRADRLRETPRAAPLAQSGFGSVAVFAFNSVELKRGTAVAGDVVVNHVAMGPTLEPGFELGLDAGVTVTGDVRAAGILQARGAVVEGTVYCNRLEDKNAPPGVCSQLELPVFAVTPVFHQAVVRAVAPNVFVANGETVVLTSDQDYGDVTVAGGGVLRLSGGGVFNLRSISTGGACPFPCGSVEVDAPSEVRVEDRFDGGRNSYIGPAPGSGLTASDVVFFVAGSNGGDGAPEALPPAATAGRGSVVAANFYAAFGTLLLDKVASASGAFLGRDVRVDAAAGITLDSYFIDRPPVAFPQTVSTNGAPSITLTLEGSDPEGEDLGFAITVFPTQGTLSAPIPVVPPPVEERENPGQFLQPPITQATVVYTPSFPGESREDSFTFQVTDLAGGSGSAVVQINPPGDPTVPVEIEEITAEPAFAETFRDLEVTVSLEASVPAGVSVTFAVVSGPSFGGLSPVAQLPPDSASVTYTPGTGFTGEDSFDFEACGLVDGVEQCRTATATVTVIEPQVVAQPQLVETPGETPVEITLGATAGSEGPLPGAGGLRSIAGRAAFLDPAEIAGNVADADGDGLGDNHNVLPGPAPVLMSAGAGLSGGPGSNGTVRIVIEWDVAGVVSPNDLESAQVILSTLKGSIDSLDTFFFVGTGEQDGLLTDDDFEAPAEEIPNVVMTVPDAPTGTEGTFSFDVTELLRLALEQDRSFFSMQGRVDENLPAAEPQRGLQVRTTADGNVQAFLQPQLAIATPGVVASPLSFSITALPLHGTLLDAFEGPILEVPTLLLVNRVTYVPDLGFTGADSFTFRVQDSFTATFASAVIDIVVGSAVGQGNCQDDVIFCDDGRP